MRRMISFIAIVLLVMIGCSGGSGGDIGPKTAAYNSVYGVNALSKGENISLHVGDEMIETVLSYDENASIIEKAFGSDNVVYYSVGSSGDYGNEPLQDSRTYFYAATDCNDTVGIKQDVLLHIVETDTQINIVNTSSDAFSKDDVNISVDGVQVNTPGDVQACGITPVVTPSAADQNISVSFSGSAVWKIFPSDANTSVDVVIYSIPQEEAAIIPLPRLTPDAR